MATADDGRTSIESGGAREISGDLHFRPEINEETQNVTQEEPGKISSTGSDQGVNSATTRTSELEQMLKQRTYMRSEVQHPTPMESLPDDLLSNIFIRLLAKQLAQMRSVSKSWNSLLSQSSFVKSHLHHSIHNNNQILLVFYNYTNYFQPKPFSAHPCRSPHLELLLTNFIKLPPVNPKFGHLIIKVIGSVHGLICSRYGDDVLHIWNPSLSAVLNLPPCLIRSSPGYKIFFRFGFDPKTDDYKVVKLSCLVTRPSGSYFLIVKEWLQVEVYSMRKGSWGLVTSRFPSHVTWFREHDGVCVDGHDGHLHWSGHIDEVGKPQTIVTFDLGSETFSEMPFPDSVLDDKRSNALGVLAGKLCVMSWVDTDAVYEIWVMEEYGVAESWDKRHVFSHFSADGSLGFTLHNEFLLEVKKNHEGCLILYDPIANETKIFKESDYDVVRCRVDKVVLYTDSLAWVAPGQREMVDGAHQI